MGGTRDAHKALVNNMRHNSPIGGKAHVCAGLGAAEVQQRHEEALIAASLGLRQGVLLACMHGLQMCLSARPALTRSTALVAVTADVLHCVLPECLGKALQQV
jgi:hypothetical protein